MRTPALLFIGALALSALFIGVKLFAPVQPAQTTPPVVEVLTTPPNGRCKKADALNAEIKIAKDNNEITSTFFILFSIQHFRSCPRG
jgi:hypothetical protein